MKPYYETELGKLYHGDCLEIMPQLEPVDLVITSPPYNINNTTGGGIRGGANCGKWPKAKLINGYNFDKDDAPQKVYLEKQRMALSSMWLRLNKDGDHKKQVYCYRFNTAHTCHFAK
jgi:modification methylase